MRKYPEHTESLPVYAIKVVWMQILIGSVEKRGGEVAFLVELVVEW